MKRFNFKLLLVVPTWMVATMASAQIRHGLAIDFGKNHREDTTHVTNFSMGVTSHTDTLKGVQANMLSNYALRLLQYFIISYARSAAQWCHEHLDGRGEGTSGSSFAQRLVWFDAWHASECL